MGTVKCQRCGGHTEANSLQEGAEKIDHAVGLAAGHPCDEARADLIMVGDQQAPTPKPTVEKPKIQEQVEESKRSSKAKKTSDKEAS